jgi:hypothetical protein
MSGLTTLFDNGDFSYLVELEPTFWNTQTGYTLAIYSRRRSAKNTSESRQCFFACLDREGLENLGRLITKQLAKYAPSYPEGERQMMNEFAGMSRSISSVFRNGTDLSGRDTP